jgi:hypothetical protein
MRRYIKDVCVATSVLLNVVLGGELNQSFAARMWQRKKDNKLNIVFILDLFFGRDHCVYEWVTWRVLKDT